MGYPLSDTLPNGRFTPTHLLSPHSSHFDRLCMYSPHQLFATVLALLIHLLSGHLPQPRYFFYKYPILPTRPIVTFTFLSLRFRSIAAHFIRSHAPARTQPHPPIRLPHPNNLHSAWPATHPLFTVVADWWLWESVAGIGRWKLWLGAVAKIFR